MLLPREAACSCLDAHQEACLGDWSHAEQQSSGAWDVELDVGLRGEVGSTENEE